MSHPLTLAVLLVMVYIAVATWVIFKNGGGNNNTPNATT